MRRFHIGGYRNNSLSRTSTIQRAAWPQPRPPHHCKTSRWVKHCPAGRLEVMVNPALPPPLQRGQRCIKRLEMTVSPQSRRGGAGEELSRMEMKDGRLTLCFLRMATASFSLWLLLVGSLTSQLCCQHWSYGLSPGGKRDVDGLSDSVDRVTICQPRVLTCLCVYSVSSHSSPHLSPHVSPVSSGVSSLTVMVLPSSPQVVVSVPRAERSSALLGCVEKAASISRIFGIKEILVSFGGDKPRLYQIIWSKNIKRAFKCCWCLCQFWWIILTDSISFF